MAAFQEWFRVQLKRAGSLSEFAWQLHLSLTAMRAYRDGRVLPMPEIVERMAKATGEDVALLHAMVTREREERRERRWPRKPLTAAGGESSKRVYYAHRRAVIAGLAMVLLAAVGCGTSATTDATTTAASCEGPTWRGACVSGHLAEAAPPILERGWQRAVARYGPMPDPGPTWKIELYPGFVPTCPGSECTGSVAALVGDNVTFGTIQLSWYAGAAILEEGASHEFCHYGAAVRREHLPCHEGAPA